jgi:hypothetical protein
LPGDAFLIKGFVRKVKAGALPAAALTHYENLIIYLFAGNLTRGKIVMEKG